jgi:hypothetical protein
MATLSITHQSRSAIVKMENTTSEDTPVQLEDFENEEDLELTAVECPSPTINKIADITKMQEG